MAIDSRQKRQSSGLIGLPFKVGTVVPTGTIGVAQRQAAGWYYSGIDTTSVAVTVTDVDFSLAQWDIEFSLAQPDVEFSLAQWDVEFVLASEK